MRNLALWFGLAILIVGGVLILMFSKNDSTNLVNNNIDNENKADSNFDIDEYRKRLKDKDKIKRKEKVNDDLNPDKSKDKNQSNIELSLEEDKESVEKKFKLIAENTSDQPQTLSFGTSQRYDYEIFNEAGEMVHHYADGKSFLQVVEEVDLEVGEKIDYEITLPSLEAGDYTLVVYFGGSTGSVQREVAEFSID